LTQRTNSRAEMLFPSSLASNTVANVAQCTDRKKANWSHHVHTNSLSTRVARLRDIWPRATFQSCWQPKNRLRRLRARGLGRLGERI